MGKRFAPRWPGILLLAMTVFWPFTGAAETLALPVTLDFALIRALIIQQIYTDPGPVAVVLNENNGCQVLELSDPSFAEENGLVRFRTGLKLKAGVAMFKDCRSPVTFNGSIEVRQKIVLEMPGWRLKLKTVGSRLLDQTGKPAKLPDVLWALVQKFLHPFLDAMEISLLPPVEQLQTLLPLFIAAGHQDRIAGWLRSARPGAVEIAPDAIRVPLLMDVADIEKQAEPGQEKPLSPEETIRFIDNWQAWDAFLVHGIRSLTILGLDPEANRKLLDILLETRYRFMTVLAAEQNAGAPDLVRQQFIAVWQQIAPLARSCLTATPSASLLSYLAFFSAGDALAVLDRIGPSLDLEIYRDGLIRMARLIAADAPIDLNYSYDVDPLLRSALGFGPPLDESGPSFPDETLDLEEPGPSEPKDGIRLDGFEFWSLFFSGQALAASVPPQEMAALMAWVVDETRFDTYLPKVCGLLQEQAQTALESGSLDRQLHPLFINLVQAVAWQESCMRQFVVTKGKLAYLRSWNNTSVGLMQINERVWRGLYRVESLRWNPAYNVKAGTEILHLYLQRYVLKEPSARLDPDTMARAAYALYNAGPGDLKAFSKRQASGTYFKSDTLFWDKYKLAKNGAFEQVGVCLFGNVPPAKDSMPSD